MKSRDAIALIIAFLIAVGVAYVARLVLLQKDVEVKQVAPIVKAEEKIDVLVAAKALYVGDEIAPSDVKWVAWPTSSEMDGYLIKDNTGPKDFVGSIVSKVVNKGEPIVGGDLIKVSDRSLLSILIDPNKRAMAINVEPAALAGGLIVPGDYVDVVQAISGASAGGGGEYKGTTIARHLKVLAVDKNLGGQKMERSTGDAPAKTVTLEVTESQAERLAKSQRDGSVFLTLYSIKNHNKVIKNDVKVTAKKDKSIHSNYYPVSVIRRDKVKNVQMGGEKK